MDNQNSNIPYPQYQAYTQHQANVYAAPKQPSGWGKLWAAIGLAFAVSFVQILGLVLGMLSRSDTAMFAAAELVGGIAAMLFVLALGGKKLATPSLDGIGETWRIIRWIFITDAVIALIEIIGTIQSGEFALASDWFLRTLLVLILCVGVGVYEEFTFRGLIFNGLLSRMGVTNKGMFWAIIISSLIFGLMHVDPFNMNWADPSQLLQALLKIVQTGIFGFAAAVAVLRTRNIWPIALFHCLNDFILMLMYNGLMENPISTEYVLSGDEGLTVIAVYLVLIVAYVPALVASVRALKQHHAPDRGQFYRGRTYPAAYVTAPPMAYTVPQTGYTAPPASTPMQPAPAQQTPAQPAPVQQAIVQPPAYPQEPPQPPSA